MDLDSPGDAAIIPTPSESRVTVSGTPSKAVELLRKRLRLSLGAMMIVVLGIGCVLGWVAHRAHVQRDAVAAITTLRRNTRASVYYDWQYVAGQGNKAAQPQGPKWMRDALGTFDANAKPWGPKWLRDALGPDVFDTVVNVNIEGDNVDDELLANVGKLHGVEWFTIQGHAAPDLTPAGMAQLRTLSRLKGLGVRGFTDSHGFVAGLTGKTRLRRLWLPEAAVTDDEMATIGGCADLEVLQLDGRNVSINNLKSLMTYSSFVVRRDDGLLTATALSRSVAFMTRSSLVTTHPYPARRQHEAGHALIEQKFRGTPTKVARPAHEEW